MKSLRVARVLFFLPLLAAFARAEPADFEGTWLGRVTAPQGATEIGFAFRPAGNGKPGLVTSVWMPAMFLHGATFGPAEIEGATLRFRPLDTELTLEGERLVGTFGLGRLPVELRRGGSFAPAPPPPEYPPAPKPRWSAALGAETWASPVARDGTIYLGCADGKFHALDAATGRRRWTWTGPNALYGAGLVTDDRVYFVDQRSDLVCLTRADGRLVWRTSLYDEMVAGGPLPANPTFNRRTPAPVLAGGLLYLGSPDRGLYAIDAATGGVRWRHHVGAKIVGTIGVEGGTLWLGGGDGTVLAFDRRTQREIVRTKLPGPVVSTPVVVGEAVVVGCRDYMLYGLRRAELARAWAFSFWFSWVESTPAVADGRVFVGGSDFARVTALDPATGRADWSTVVHGLSWGTPLVTADTVFAAASAQRSAILPHAGGVLALDRRSGAVRWRHVLPLAAGADRAGCVGSLALAGDLVIAAAVDGTVLAFPAR